MKIHNSRHGCHRCGRHHVRVINHRHMLRSITRGLGLVAMIAGLCGIAFFGLKLALDQMTTDDCQAGVQAACEALQR